LVTFYPSIPAATLMSSTGTPDLSTSSLSKTVARGHVDGGGLQIYVLDHGVPTAGSPTGSDLRVCGANPGVNLPISCV
jgi:hypothetical protein